MYLILDASAFLSGRFTSIPDGYDGVVTTSAVKDEINKGAPKRNLQNLLEVGLKVHDPISSEKAKELALRTGDLELLSNADLSIIAIALELKDAMVITDDFRVQNVLTTASIGFQPAGEIGDRTIKKVWNWTYRCRGCGRFFDLQQKNDDCPICGSEVRKVRKK